MADYIIITAEDCVWCERAKAKLDARDLTYAEFSTSEPNIRHLFFTLNVKTVPQIFLSASGNRQIEYIGGYDDLCKRLAYAEFDAHTNSH